MRTIFGSTEVEDPLVEEILYSKIMKRLKKINQSGVSSYFGFSPDFFSRYSHSIGVFHLLKKVNASRKERIAGLLHDVSHTVFSHSGDYLFLKDHRKEGYQDSIHKWFLEKFCIGKILNKYDLNIDEILPENKDFTALEQPLPDMCAD
jgi:HD superfamily phosphohydrolase